MKAFLILIFLVVGGGMLAVDVTVHLQRQTTSMNLTDVVMSSFCATEEFSAKNALISVGTGELLNLSVVNHDTVVHTLTIDGILESGNDLQPGETVAFELTFNDEGSYRFYSESPMGGLLGASGMILVGFEDHPRYFWNLFDLQTDLTFQLSDGLTDVIPTDYQPDLFFINGAHYPNTINDPNTYVQESVGEQIIIAIANGGNMDHILHFHGYHVEILQSHLQGDRVGWIKDSIPVKAGDALTVMLTPDKPGEYPVHDHNLITVTNAGFYPGGMITYLNITE
ncbi:MAG: multicopper oxidase domain-containing protein [Flavobacteriales bacterium]|nr:multicopper oxidase domain-containing protein [Flavobacteriales bacterium]